MQSKPASIDEYLARVPADRRAALEQLRQTIHAILPNVEECISYSMPAFRHEGRVVAGFLATARGCSYYPFSGTTLGALAAELGAYGQTKSALHFDPLTPLPKALVRRLLAARIAEGSAHSASRSGPKRASERAGSKRASERAGSKRASKRAGSKRASKRAGSKRASERAGSKRASKRAGSRR